MKFIKSSISKFKVFLILLQLVIFLYILIVRVPNIINSQIFGQYMYTYWSDFNYLFISFFLTFCSVILLKIKISISNILYILSFLLLLYQVYYYYDSSFVLLTIIYFTYIFYSVKQYINMRNKTKTDIKKE